MLPALLLLPVLAGEPGPEHLRDLPSSTRCREQKECWLALKRTIARNRQVNGWSDGRYDQQLEACEYYLSCWGWLELAQESAWLSGPEETVRCLEAYRDLIGHAHYSRGWSPPNILVMPEAPE